MASSSQSASASSSRSCKYDVFLSFRGEDTRKTFVDHLYSSLKKHLIRVYKDDEALPRGESINDSLFEAIEESQIAVIIFSKHYADSSWCLEELAHIMKCRDMRELIVIPIFYDVEPTDVRNQKSKFGEAFSKQKTKDVAKVEIWRKALVDASNIAGWETKNIADGHESQFIKKIVNTILDRLSMLYSCLDEDLVGMRARFQELESLLDIESNGVRMIGIWGLGGSGKTTLATSTCMKISQHYQGHCIVENVRERTSKDGLNKLQESVLSSIFKKEMKVHSVVEGKHMMKKMLSRRKVLLLLDDVDTLDQLEALVGNRNWFGSGSRVIITTRDEHLLKAHKVIHVYHVTLLSKDEAIQLFRRHAYNEEEPLEDYETLSLRVVSYASGLPLALKVLGSFLYDKNKDEWMSALNKLKDVPNLEVMDILKISYDGLDTYQKELFLDIACFWRFKRVYEAMDILEACGYHPEIGIKVLKQKALITIVYGEFDMHDLVQEMGHYIVRGNHPKNPEKHSRVWRREEIEEICIRNATMENNKIEAINCGDGVYLPSHFCKIVSNMKKLRWLRVQMHEYDKYVDGPTFLSNELLYMDWKAYPSRSPFPDSFQPTKLVVLKLSHSYQKELWKGYKRLLNLKVLQLSAMMELLNTPDFNELPCLGKLSLVNCLELQEIYPSFGNHSNLEHVYIFICPKLRRFPSISHMKNLKTLTISDCNLKDGVIGSGIGKLFNLQELDLSHNKFSRLDFSISQLTHLKVLKLSWCTNLLELPKLPSSLVIFIAMGCSSLTTMGDCHINCKGLCLVSLGYSDHVVNDIGGGRLLQSMLEGNAIENGSMLLAYPGLEIAMTFTPPLLRGSRYTLQLPKTSWCDDFSGFLMCAVSTVGIIYDDTLPTYVKLVSSYTDSEDNVFCEESDVDSKKPVGLDSKDVSDYLTWVWYVPFGSLKHTAWWDQIQTYKYLQFILEDPDYCNFGVRLVARKSGSGLTETSKKSSTKYTPNILIEHDSTSLKISTLSSVDWM